MNLALPHDRSPLFFVFCCTFYRFLLLIVQITGGITNVIFKARNMATGQGALVRVYGKDTDLLLDRRCVAFFPCTALPCRVDLVLVFSLFSLLPCAEHGVSLSFRLTTPSM